MIRQVFCMEHAVLVQWELSTLSCITINILLILSKYFSKQENLSDNAESAILEAIQSQKHGDAFYFWVRMDQDPRNHANKDFWSFCDAINAGNCRLVSYISYVELISKPANVLVWEMLLFFFPGWDSSLAFTPTCLGIKGFVVAAHSQFYEANTRYVFIQNNHSKSSMFFSY